MVTNQTEKLRLLEDEIKQAKDERLVIATARARAQADKKTEPDAMKSHDMRLDRQNGYVAGLERALDIVHPRKPVDMSDNDLHIKVVGR